MLFSMPINALVNFGAVSEKYSERYFDVSYVAVSCCVFIKMAQGFC